MSDLMLLGVLRMPPECWDDEDPIDVAQRHSRYCEAAAEIERLRKVEIAALRIVQQTRADTAYLLHDQLIEALEVPSSKLSAVLGSYGNL